MFAEDISEDFSDLTFTGFYSISGYLRNLRGRLLSSEKFSEVFTLWVFTLKPFPDSEMPSALLGERTSPEPLMFLYCGEKNCKRPDLPQESLGPFGPEVSRECPSGCLWGPSGPGLRGVQKVSRECPRSVKRVTLLTLRGHSRRTLFGHSGAPETPRGTLPGHFGPEDKCLRDSCSRPGGLQRKENFSGNALEASNVLDWRVLGASQPYS